MALEECTQLEQMVFDLGNRTLMVIHRGDPQIILDRLLPLKFGATILDSVSVESENIELTSENAKESKVLKQLLLLNLIMFFVELGSGYFSRSAGLIADGLDMLADASVYGLSLMAVGKAKTSKQHVARLSGYLQFIMAAGLLVEVVRRFLYGSEPIGSIISSVAIVALCVNILCLFLLMNHRKGEVHMRASWIFSANDVLANIGVIVAGSLVSWTGSNYPDLIMGSIISAIVMRGAVQILNLSKRRN
ncbi:cation transporter [Pseudobacteriovorax antillogorgiicola]|nr:cation transporter [Pseudobacteriovorax antillogorgiicola]